MCELATASLVLTGLSTAYSVYSGIQTGNAQAKAAEVTASNNQKIANYNADIAENNAVVQKVAATDALNRGANDAAVQRENYRKANASARAAEASTGLLVDTGSNLDITGDNASTGTLNSLTVQNNAEREAYGYTQKATDFESQAAALRFGGQVGVANAASTADAYRAAGINNAASSLVTGASSVAQQYKALPASSPLKLK